MVADSSIKVAVRLRPFNDREKNQKQGAQLVVGMDDKNVVISHPTKKENKPFRFDNALWSHDEFKEESNGYLSPTGSLYADQNHVYKELGAPLLENALEGFNCAIFAYGQTGSGKSYSIFGNDANQGIIPMIINNLYKHIDAKRSKGEVDFAVRVTMLEIYNEQVRDLFTTTKSKLAIRMNKNKEFYVPGLIDQQVYSYEDVNTWIKTGEKNRTIEATKMNQTSSRAHTIFTVKLTQTFKSSSKVKESEMVLVDLAGSEKIGKTGSKGARQAEGININKSLSTLAKVFKALYDLQRPLKEGQTRKTIQPPYRDSSLTMLLQKALSGNSKTVMIAAISPDLNNFEESLNTLRYADTVKALKTKAVVNIQSKNQAMDDLQRELERLRQEQANYKAVEVQKIVEVQNLSDEERRELEEKMEKQRQELEIEIKNRENEINALTSNYEKRLEEHKAESEARIKKLNDFQEKKRTEPHLWNLAKDSRETGNIIHFLHRGVTMGGSQQNSGIPLKYPGIMPQHIRITNNNNKLITLEFTQQGQQSKFPVHINGKSVSTRVKHKLFHGDQISFGMALVFVLHHPEDASERVRNGEDASRGHKSYDEVMDQIDSYENQLKDNQRTLADSNERIQLMQDVAKANFIGRELFKNVFYEIVNPKKSLANAENGIKSTYIYAQNDDGVGYYLEKEQFEENFSHMEGMYADFQRGKDVDLEPGVDPFVKDGLACNLVGVAQAKMNPVGYVGEKWQTIKLFNLSGENLGTGRVKHGPCDELGNRQDVFRGQVNYSVEFEKLRFSKLKPKTTEIHYSFIGKHEKTRPQSKEIPDFEGDKKTVPLGPENRLLRDQLAGGVVWIQIHGIIKGRERMNREMTGMTEPIVDEEKENMSVELEDLKLQLAQQNEIIANEKRLREEQQKVLADLVQGQALLMETMKAQKAAPPTPQADHTDDFNDLKRQLQELAKRPNPPPPNYSAQFEELNRKIEDQSRQRAIVNNFSQTIINRMHQDNRYIHNKLNFLIQDQKISVALRNDVASFMRNSCGGHQWWTPELFKQLMREIKIIHAKVDKLLKCACKCDEKEIKEVVASIEDFEFPDIKSPGPVSLKAPELEKDMKPKQVKLEVQIQHANTYEQLTLEQLEELQESTLQSEVVTQHSIREQPPPGGNSKSGSLPVEQWSSPHKGASATSERQKSGKKAIESSKTKQPVGKVPEPPTTVAIKTTDIKQHDMLASEPKTDKTSCPSTESNPPAQKTKSEKPTNKKPPSKPVDSKKNEPKNPTKTPTSKEDSKKSEPKNPPKTSTSKEDSKKKESSKNSKSSKDPLKTSSRSISPPVPPSSDDVGNPTSEACAIM